MITLMSILSEAELEKFTDKTHLWRHTTTPLHELTIKMLLEVANLLEKDIIDLTKIVLEGITEHNGE